MFFSVGVFPFWGRFSLAGRVEDLSWQDARVGRLENGQTSNRRLDDSFCHSAQIEMYPFSVRLSFFISSTIPKCYTALVSERPRLYQLRFDDQFQPTAARDVTPANFAGSPRYGRESGSPVRIPAVETPGRFVREVTDRVQVTWPAEAARFLVEQVYTPFEAFDQEELHVLLLNNKHYCTHTAMIYRGTINSISVRPAEVVREAVRVSAAALVISHNHPSGTPDPSPEDITITKRINWAAEILDIRLLDHIIVGHQGRWVSLKEHGVDFS